MTPADRQLVEWYLSRGPDAQSNPSASIAIGYLLAKAKDPARKFTGKIEAECERVLDALRTQRLREQLG